MILKSIHHVQLAMPEGGEVDARAFYAGVLGVPEAEKPDNLKARGGCWFEAEGLRIHLGVEQDFRPARKAHPAFVVDDVAAVAAAVEKAGYAVKPDEPLEGFLRTYVYDPFGNRIELMQVLD
nr:VOC family protein [Marinicella sp. W31]MDC2876304.1 VOC family protein [Marinicella sp. W31]